MFNSDEIRLRLHEYVVAYPISFQALARQININQATLKNFIQGNKVANSQSLAKIENFLRTKEQVCKSC